MLNSNPRPMTIYSARCCQNAKNTSYPDWRGITCAEDLKEAVAFDHVFAEYRGNRRSIKNFVRSDCVAMDLDNGHSDNPEDWKDLDDVKEAFPGIPFYAVPSRNHMKVKNGKAPRPKYHIYFPTEEITDPDLYRAVKVATCKMFPEFDEACTDPARFYFGVEAPEVITVKGKEGATLTAFLGPLEPLESAGAAGTGGEGKPLIVNGIIPILHRNATLHTYAVDLLKKYGEDGDVEQARAIWEQKYIPLCEKALPESDLETIWNSALKFYITSILPDPDHLPHSEYMLQEFKKDLKPEYFTDVGEADALVMEYGGQLAWSPQTGWMVYDGTRWTESEEKARGLVKKLAKRQAKMARNASDKANKAIMKAVEIGDKEAEERAQRDLKAARDYHKSALRYQQAPRVLAVLTMAASDLLVDIYDLDKDGFLLNTPAGTVDLRTGEMRPHDPADHCTKITSCAPGAEGAELFEAAVDRVTGGDRQLAEYLQLVMGKAAMGERKSVDLIIALGKGGNGKSTIFNLLQRAMGDYGDSMSTEIFDANFHGSRQAEYYDLRGKRLVIAPEMEEGTRLSISALKAVGSKDRIRACQKFKQGFRLEPSHTVVLYTNHLPRVGSLDKGTWDRLKVVPLNVRFRGEAGEIQDYDDYLFEHAGGAALQWMIDGARKVIAADFRIELPDCVKAAIADYRADNDWLQQFIDECCDVEPNYKQPSGELYNYYRMYCARTGEYPRHVKDFKHALQDRGFEFRKTMTGNIYQGLRLKPKELGFYNVPDYVPAGDPLE